MKKVITVIIGLVLGFTVFGCGKKVNPNLNTNNLFPRSNSGSGLNTQTGTNQGTTQGSSQGSGNSNKPNGNVNNNVGTTQGYNNQGVTAGYFTDGVYAGSGTPTATGNQMALVYIKGGKIINVALNSIDANGNTIFDSTGRINAGANTGTASGANNNAAYGANVTQDRVNLANAIVKHQTPDVNINITSGNTALVNNWKLAVSRALARALR